MSLLLALVDEGSPDLVTAIYHFFIRRKSRRF